MARRDASLPPHDRPDVNGQSSQFQDPWALVWGQPYIDATRLAAAIEHDLQHKPHPDFRTRLLVRDAIKAIKAFWGRKKFTQWLEMSPAEARIGILLKEDLGGAGFPHIRRRLVASLGATQLGQIFDLLGRQIHDRTEVSIAGSIPTLIRGLTARPTADIDFVNEVPAAIRRQRSTLKQIRDTYGLDLGHVQSHYLPVNWEQRRSFLDDYGGLRVYLVSEFDIFVSKLSSKQEKHQDDPRVLAQHLDKEKVRQLLFTDGKPFLDDRTLRPQIEENWRFIYQEPLQSPATQPKNRRARPAREIPPDPTAQPAKERKGRTKKKPPP